MTNHRGHDGIGPLTIWEGRREFMTPEQAAAYLQGEVPDIALRRYTAAEIAEFLQRDQLDAEAQEVVRRFGAACEQS